MRARDGGAWRDIDSGQVRVAGSWQQLTEARAYIGGAWETVASFIPDLSVSASPIGASGIIADGGLATTNSVTVTPAGGSAPYTYAWTFVSGDSVTVNSPASATTSFSTTLAPEDETSSVYRCTVTDDNGTTATVDVIVNLASFSSS